MGPSRPSCPSFVRSSLTSVVRLVSVTIVRGHRASWISSFETAHGRFETRRDKQLELLRGQRDRAASSDELAAFRVEGEARR